MQTNTIPCELCTRHHPREIWRNDLVYVVDAGDDDMPGFIRVVLTRHVAEMSDLSAFDRDRLWKLINLIELEMRHYMKPAKINLAQLGNMVPHLHWHIIARYSDDAFFPNSIWGQRLREVDPGLTQQRREQAAQLLKYLPDLMATTA